MTTFTKEGDYQVFPPDERRRVIDTSNPPFRYICKLESVFAHPHTGRRQQMSGTGTLIGPDKLLTAAHCLYVRGFGYARQVRVIPGKNGPQKHAQHEPFGHTVAMQLSIPTHYRLASSLVERRLFDYGVVRLKQAIGKRVGWWRSIRPVTANILLKHNVNTAGYPADRGGQYLYLAKDRIVRVHSRRLEYQHDTFAGQSGSPIWICWHNQHIMVGIHTTRDLPGAPVANTGIRITPNILANIHRW